MLFFLIQEPTEQCIKQTGSGIWNNGNSFVTEVIYVVLMIHCLQGSRIFANRYHYQRMQSPKLPDNCVDQGVLWGSSPVK